MIVRVQSGTGSNLDCTRRRTPETRRTGPESEEPGRALVPVRPVVGHSRPKSLGHKPCAAFLAQLCLQYTDRGDRARARKQRIDRAVSAYSRSVDFFTRAGTARDFHT